MRRRSTAHAALLAPARQAQLVLDGLPARAGLVGRFAQAQQVAPIG